MGTGYTRNDTSNNIADGNIINAADFDGEYDAIEAAFNSSTGHTHDGTSAEGAPITVLGPSQEFVASSSEVKPSTNAGLDLGTNTLKFKDLYLDGTAYIDGLGGNLLVDTTNALQFRDAQLSINSSADGQLDIAADTTAKITSPEVIVTDDFRLQSDAAILTFGADNDVTVTHVADTGLDAKAASGFVLKLQTGDTTVESGNTLGKISFNAPDEAGGTDAILVGAEIEAAAEATFSSTDNSTALVFKTNTSAAATERMRIKSDGDIVTQGANYTMTWDHSADTLRFADNAKATFGASDDLQIYHDGSNSYVDDAGLGALFLRGNAVVLGKYTGERMLDGTADAEVNLYYDNAIKLATTTDGIDVTGDISVGNLNIITNTISSTDTNGDINLSPNGTGTVVINTDLDVDNININGNSITSTDTNGDINITPNGTGKVNIAGGFVPSEINLTSTDAGATAGPVFELHRNSASPADNDLIGAIDFAGQDSGGNKVIYASIDAQIMDVTDTTEDGRLDFITQVAGSNYSRMRFDPTETVFNEAGANIDFRVEGDTEQNLFFVDAGNDRVGIKTANPDYELQVGDDNTNVNSTIAVASAGSSEKRLVFYRASNKDWEIVEDTSENLSINSNGITGKEFVINNASNDTDFRVESDSNAHMLFVDAGNDRIGMNESSPQRTLHINGGTTNTVLRLESTDAEVYMEFRDSGGVSSYLGYNGTELRILPNNDEVATFNTTGIVFNEDSDDKDFRVESNGNTHGIFLDASTDRVGLLGNRTGDVTTLSVGDIGQGNGQATENGTTDAIIYSDSAISSNTILALDGGASGFSGTNEVGVDHHLDFRACAFLATPSGTGIEQHVGARISLSKDKSWNESSAGAGIYSSLIFYTQGGTYTTPSLKENLRLTRSSAIFNDDSGDMDFRVESDASANGLFLDAGHGGVGINDAGSSSYQLTVMTGAMKSGAFIGRNTDSALRSHVVFYSQNQAAIVGQIKISNSATSYVTSSDYRLKENVVDLTDATTRLKQLQPKRFSWIVDEEDSANVDGFLAHEVSDIVPEAVSGEKDALDENGNPEYQGIDHSKLVPLLVATIKELEARITALENA